MTRRRVSALLVLLAAIAVVVDAVVSSGSPSKPNNADPSTSSGATAVERRDLVETDAESGTLSCANSRRRPTTDEQAWLPPLESGRVAACSNRAGQNARLEVTGRRRARLLPPARQVAEATESALLIVQAL